MVRLLLLSVVIALVVLPVVCARDPSPRRGLKRSVLLLVTFHVVYALVLNALAPRLDD